MAEELIVEKTPIQFDFKFNTRYLINSCEIEADNYKVSVRYAGKMVQWSMLQEMRDRYDILFVKYSDGTSAEIPIRVISVNDGVKPKNLNFFLRLLVTSSMGNSDDSIITE